MRQILLNNSTHDLAFSRKGAEYICSLLRAEIDDPISTAKIDDGYGGVRVIVGCDVLGAADFPRHSDLLIKTFDELGAEAFTDLDCVYLADIHSTKYIILDDGYGGETATEIDNSMIIDTEEETNLC